MNRLPVVALLLLLPLDLATAQREVPLKLWMEVKGTGFANYEEMGLCVTAVPASSPNLPYRGTVSRNGRTNFYTLKDSLDTQPAYSIPGEHLLLGDLNGDGLTDAVVVNTVADLAPNNNEIVRVYWGLPQGLDTVHPLLIPGYGVGQGIRPSCLADVNNDGKLDLLLWSNPPKGYFALQIYLGPNLSATPDTILRGDSTYWYFGGYANAVAVADLNGDGLNDLVVRGGFGRLVDSNWVRIYWGKPGKLVSDSITEIHGGPGTYYGIACFDVNGDGVADLLRTDLDSVSTAGYDIFVHLGGPAFSTRPSFWLQNPGRVPNFGYSPGTSIVNAGDMNGDGFSDIAVSADEANYTDGFVFVYGGGPRVDSKFDAAAGTSDDADFGYSIAPIGDVNGDGLADLLVGAPKWYYGRYQGYWAVILGSKAMTVTTVKDQGRAADQPGFLELNQNYPNPFNPETSISYRLGEPATVTLEVLNLLGQRVALLQDKVRQQAGSHSICFHPREGTASGVYFSRLTAITTAGKRLTLTRPMLFLK